MESILERVPILKLIYKPLKNIFSKFSDTQGRSNFKQVVLVDFPNTKGKSIGFVTNTHISLWTLSEKICVFVPTSPNPTMGFLMLYDKADVTDCRYHCRAGAEHGAVDWKLVRRRTYTRSPAKAKTNRSAG